MKGIQGETKEEYDERETEEKKKIENIQTTIKDGIQSKINIIKDNIATLEIFNYNKDYTIYSLLQLTFSETDKLEEINTDELTIIKNLIDNYDYLLLEAKKI